jgi:peptide/nickel transport system substrate-binding protein
MRKKLKLASLFIAAGLVLAACGSGEESGDATSEESTGSAEIVIALGSEPTSLDPQLVDDGGERAINDNIYETLLVRDADGNIGPGLAADMPTQVDETTWEFKLREGVTFHDGSPFDSASVVATVERMVKLVADGKTQNDGFFKSLTGASAKDVADLSDAPNGTGPYKFDSRSVGVSIVLTANDSYWGDKANVSKVTFEFIADSATRLAGLTSGKYDVITNLNPQDAASAPVVATAQGQEHPVLILDADEGITKDLRVRQALNYAVDKQTIADTLFGGYGVVDAGQLLSPSILGFNSTLSAYPYDVEKAKALLEEAGATGAEIQLVGESGRWLKDKELLEAVAGYWTAAGLTVNLEILEFGAYLDVLFDRENRADSVYVSSSNDILDADRQLSTYYQAGGIGSSNSNEALKKLIDDGRSELDATKRGEIYAEAVKIAYDEAYFVWIINNQDIYGLSTRLAWTPRVDSKLLVKEMTVN